ncbi:MAG: (2Fe-2S) ferredoxin domain-containing protein [Pseudomonadales bacterium]|nr:(2Fe-2S) ferredoxin domain-containing protein [Pseudomonadales bacterium]
MTKPQWHVFVCTHRRSPGHPRSSCAERASDELYTAFAQGLLQRNLQQRVALTATACLGPCQAGVNVLVYPGAVMYSWVEPADVAKLLDEHLLQGTPYQDKLTPEELW